MVAKSITWEALLPVARTGDIVLFHTDKLLGQAIDDVTGGGKYSHVGMIVRPDPNRPPQLWEESSVSIAPDSDSKTTPLHTGAQHGDLQKAVAKYLSVQDRPSYRRLHLDRTPAFEAKVQEVIATCEGHPFGSILSMVEHWFEGHFLAEAAPDTQMFCSQLVALTYQRAGLLSTEHVPNWYSPNSFSAGYHALHLLQGASLDPEVPIDVDGH